MSHEKHGATLSLNIFLGVGVAVQMQETGYWLAESMLHGVCGSVGHFDQFGGYRTGGCFKNGVGL